ncbi:hypothetical protein ACHQM5_020289 [Ranunculus cassubicifolius]
MEGRESTTVSSSPTTTNTGPESPPMSGGGGGMVPQMMNMAVSVSMETHNNIGVRGGGGGGMEMLAKKKRGRPRKYAPDGSLALALSPNFYSSSPDFSEKRGRGRPPGSGNRQVLASLGEWVLNSAGGNFTPHVVTINAGEDVAAKIVSFSQRGPRAICILSANGAVSNVTIRQPGSSGGILTYEGRFEILALSGSFTLSETGGIKSRTGGLSVSLAGPDGRVIGGGVAGHLIAASPIQVVVGSFMPNNQKPHKRKHQLEPSTPSPIPAAQNVVTMARPISQAIPEEETCATPTSTLPEQGQVHVEPQNITNDNQIPIANNNQNPITNNNQNPVITPFGQVHDWHGAESTSLQKPSPDINLTVAADQ